MNHDCCNSCFYFFFFFSPLWLNNAARPVNSTASPVNQDLSKTQPAAHLPCPEKSPHPASGNSAAATTGSADTSSAQQPASPQPSSAGPDVASPPATSVMPVPGVAPSAVTQNVAASLSSSAAAVHARFGRTSKYATKDTPRTLGVKCVVDFEKIYHYLSEIHKPDKECNLTPMGETSPPTHTDTHTPLMKTQHMAFRNNCIGVKLNLSPSSSRERYCAGSPDVSPGGASAFGLQ